MGETVNQSAQRFPFEMNIRYIKRKKEKYFFSMKVSSNDHYYFYDIFSSLWFLLECMGQAIERKNIITGKFKENEKHYLVGINECSINIVDSSKIFEEFYIEVKDITSFANYTKSQVKIYSCQEKICQGLFSHYKQEK